MKSALTRLEELEKRHLQDPLIVIAELPDTKELQKMTVAEMLETGSGFVKVVSGSSLTDLDKILESIATSVIE
jgi:hypothetical protein